MAFAMLTIFMLVVVFVRIVYQYKLSGDHGIRPASRQASTETKIASVLFMMSFVGIFVLSVVEVSNGDHTHPTDTMTRISFGVLVYLVGIFLISYSQFVMGRSWRMGMNENETTTLVTTGIYSRVRHPIYTGVAFFLLGEVLLIPHLTTIVLVGLGLLSIHLHVRYVEEPYLTRIHGEVFTKYQESTGTYFPKM